MRFLIVGVCAFASQTIYAVHYTNGIDEMIVSVSPVDGDLYVIVNGINHMIFRAAGITDAGIAWHNDSFGDLLSRRSSLTRKYCHKGVNYG